MARQAMFRLNNMTGGINTMSQDNALVGIDKSAESGVEFVELTNVSFTDRGGLKTVDGYDLYYDTGSSAVTGIGRYRKANNDTWIVYSTGTTVKAWNGTTLSSVCTVSNGAIVHFETAMDKLVICDGVSQIQLWDGSSVTNIPAGTVSETAPPVGMKQTVFYQDRLFGFGPSGADSSYVYYSKSGEFTDMGGGGGHGGFIPCDLSDGEKVTGICKFFIPGNIQPVLVVTKTNSVGIITGTGTTDDPYVFLKVDQDFGSNTFRTLVPFSYRFAYLTPNGVSTYTAGDNQVKLLAQYISEKVRDSFQGFNYGVAAAIGWHDYKNSSICYAVPEGGKSLANVVWCYDYRFNAWYTKRFNNTEFITSAFVDDDGTVYHGTSIGNIYIHGSQYKTFNDETINCVFKFGFWDFGDPNVQKQIRELKFSARPSSQVNFGIGQLFDYGAKLGTSMSISLTGSPYLWGAGEWNDDGSYKWGAPSVTTKRCFPRGLFNNVQLSGYFAQNNVTLEIFEIETVVEYMDWGR